ncbi:hypothetical protein GmHk_16G045377 [Glycine max]|nr:hypothetical protein GmHk_16G045377 [Glycine max]
MCGVGIGVQCGATCKTKLVYVLRCLGFLSSLLPPIFHSPQNISTFSSLPQQNSKNFPSYLLFTSLTTTGMLHFLKVRSHSWGLQKFASFRFWVCLFHPSIVVSLILIAELNQTFFFFFMWVCVILLEGKTYCGIALAFGIPTTVVVRCLFCVVLCVSLCPAMYHLDFIGNSKRKRIIC